MSGTIASTAVKTQSSVAASDTIGSTTTATTFGSSWTLPANALSVGRGLMVVARGVYSTAIVAAGNMTLDIMGGTTVLASTGAQALTTGLGNDGWEMKADVICGATGAGGFVEVQGLVVFQTAAITANPVFMVNTAGVSFNTTVAQAVVPRVTWSATGNTITMRTYIVEMAGAQ